MSQEYVEQFRRWAQHERMRAAGTPHPAHRATAFKLADQYDAVADAYAKLVALGGSIRGGDGFFRPPDA